MTQPSTTTPVILVSTARFAVIGISGEVGVPKATRSVAPVVFQSTKSMPTVATDAAAQSKSSPSKEAQTKEVQATPALEWTDTLQQDYDRILSVGEECVTVTELKDLLLKKSNSTADDPIILYDGFEPSGRMHIAQGIFKAVNVNKCTSYFQTPNVAAKFVFWVADWFALMNDKMGGSLERIQVVGDYLQQVWKAAGMHLEYVEFILASDAITQQAHIYWPLMLDVARRFTITRIKKCCQIMGRLEGNLSAAQMLYPLMQCTDVFFLQADICQLGVDQRKVNMLAREYYEAAKNDDKSKKSSKTRLKRPIILSHHMLYGLQKGQVKMSKSNPDSAIFMEDSREDVERKITLAYCPTQPELQDEAPAVDEQGVVLDPSSPLYNGQVLKNPCLDYIQNILFSQIDCTFAAGDKNYDNYIQVQQDFCNGTLSVEHVKRGLIDAVNKLLDPVRDHFTTDPSAQQVILQVQTFAKEMKAAAEAAAAAAADTSDTTKKSVRRSSWIGLGAIHPKPSHIDHVVVAPMPTLQPTLEEALSVLQQLRHAAAAATTTSSPCLVLLLTDWSARTVNACTGDEAMIASYYDILLATLRSLDGSNGVLQHTTIIYQSQAILLDPNDYWISVINVGRYFSLQDVMGKASIQDDSTVGWVMARLLLVADLVSLAPTSTWSMNFNFRSPEQEEDEVDELVTRFWKDQSLDTALGYSCPQLVKNSTTNTNLKLQAPRPDGLVNETDEYYILDDPKVHGKSKMKKAFCEPGNVEFCPPIVLCSAFVFSKVIPSGELLVQRSEENGGNVTYTSREDLERDFASGALHPGDLKTTASNVMVEILDRVSKALQQDGKANKATKAVKAFAKKNAKKGKK